MYIYVNIFAAFVFAYRVQLIKLMNSCVFMYLPWWFLKMANIVPHSHFVHAIFVPSLVCQTFDRMIFD